MSIPKITCKCGSEFIPQYRNGILMSKSCPECRYSLEISNRLAKRKETVIIEVKEAKKGLKSKLEENRKSRLIEKKPKSYEAKLIAKLDKEFSLFIRHRDSKNGMFICISCNTPKAYEQADCGHFVNRIHMATRFDEINGNAQCRKCNRFEEGNAQGYRIGLLKKYGEQAVLILDWKKSQTKKWTKFELESLIEHYKLKNKEFDNFLSGELF